MPDFFFNNKNLFNLSDEAIYQLKTIFHPIDIKKGETFLNEGEPNYNIYIMHKGIVKTWFWRNDRERILNFIFENEPLILPTTKYNRLKVSATTVEDSILYVTNKNELKDLMKKSQELSYWGFQLIDNFITLLAEDTLDYYWMPKQDIYKLLLEKHPDVLQRIPLKDIAAYLNITPSSLSRIRANIK